MNNDTNDQVSQSPNSISQTGPENAASRLPTALRIRPMQNADIEQVIAIDQSSFSLPWPKSAFDYEINENPHSLSLVAEISSETAAQRIVGMVVVWLILDEAHIATIAVDHSYRRQGIAQLLIAEAMRQAIPRGAQIATLEVRQTNLAAQQLYQKFGFEIVGRRIRYYQDNHEDALIMTVSNIRDVHWQQIIHTIEQP